MTTTTALADSTAAPPALRELAEVSARIGADTQLIQGAGGNSSVKCGDTLWVKASGLWLRDALRRPLFTAVALGQVRQRVAAGEADAVGPALRPELSPAGLRPSIETTLHALMPQPVVLHVHSVEAIAWAVLPRGTPGLAAALAGFRWGWVDYVKPGLPLTRAVAELTAERELDVLLMANHGLVVGGATAAEAEARLQAVVAALRRPVRAAPLADTAALSALADAARALAPPAAAAPDGAGAGTATGPVNSSSPAAPSGWRLPAAPRAHAVATDPLNLARAQAGVLYPDHVVFLGATLCTAPEGLDEAALAGWLARTRSAPMAPPCVALPGRGLLVRDDLGEAAEEMLACWADVLQRLPAAPEPCHLPEEEAQALANWEAEKFRLQQQR